MQLNNIVAGQFLELFCAKGIGSTCIRCLVFQVNESNIEIILESGLFDWVEKDSILTAEEVSVNSVVLDSLNMVAAHHREIRSLEAQLAHAKEQESKYVELVKMARFSEKYNVFGAINLMNLETDGLRKMDIGDAVIEITISPGESESELEVRIVANKKFEFFNVLNKEDIERAASTYAPDVKGTIIESFPLFRDVFIIERECVKIGEYLYEARAVYSAIMDCRKESFVQTKKQFKEMLLSAKEKFEL